MRPRKLRSRMFLWFMALATVLVVVSGAAHLYETREALLELVDQELGRVARDLAGRART